jgi:hypothetical protein
MRCRLLAAVAALIIAPVLFSQEFRGAISGAVTDATGSLIPGAKVTVTETNTSTKVETATDSSGHYTVPFLLPGDYDIAVQAAGFKAFTRKGVHVGSGERPVIDVSLEVGAVTQSVEVTADAPLINTENASVGQTISAKEVEDLPTNGGTPLMLAGLSMGVVATGDPSVVQPFASGGAAGWSIAGSPSQTNEIMVDGSSNTTWDGRNAYSPPQDTVQEVRVKAFDADASYGHSGAGTLNTILKSGTNSLHGTLSEKNQPNNLVANDFFRNKSGLPVQMTHYNQYGLTVGGPVVLPKVLDGRNKLFWFFAFEGVKSASPSTVLMTVPTEAEKQGDFSKLLALASPSVIYNPFSGVPNATGSGYTRTAYPNNRIPASQFNAIALKLQEFFPQPNITNVVRQDDYQNYGSTNATRDGYTNEMGRLDYNENSRNRTYFNVRHTDYSQTKNNYYSNVATGSNLSRSNWGLTADHVFTLNAANVINVRANFTRMFEDHKAPSAGFDITQLGFPAYLATNSQYPQLPRITFASSTGIQDLGMSGANTLPSQSLSLFGNWLMIRGTHQIKVGGDLRQYRLNYRSYGSATGQFNFSSNAWTRASNSASSTVTMGQDYAAFLLGLPNGGTYDVNASAMFYQYYGAAFVQDDWRFRRNLTLNLGLRFDHDFPYHEKWGRTVNGFAFDTPSPIAAAAIAAYNARPIAQIPVGSFNVPGGLTFASPQDTSMFQNTSHLLSPRLGFAWTPEKLHNKTVIRGGFAMFVYPLGISTLQVSGAYSTNPILTQEGFSQSTALTASTDNNLTPAATLSNPFPSGIRQPAGSSDGLMTFVGQTVNFLNPKMKSPYSMRWNFGIQHSFTPNLMMEVVYMGNHGVHLPITYTQQNVIPSAFMSTLPVRDQTLITSLTASVPNPLNGLVTSGTPAGTSTNVAQLLARYPQFPVGFSSGASAGGTGVIMNDYNAGSSYFESLNVRLQKRVSRGLSVTFNYMRSKMIDQTTWLNNNDLQPEHRISPFDHPTRIVTALIYELPFGKGRLIQPNSVWAKQLLGGWKVAGIYTYQVGAPILWVNGSTNNPGDYVYFGAPLNVHNRNINSAAFDTSAFDVKSADQFQYHIRTFSTTFQDLRRDGINDVNLSVLKEFSFGERKKLLQLRGEAFNAINHPTFAAPNTQVSNSAFGTITSQANRTRVVQLVGRFVF